MPAAIQLSALDHYFADFICGLESKPCEELWIAAALASAANCRGHVCLELADAAGQEFVPFKPRPGLQCAPESVSWRAALGSCGTVGRPGDYTPLVLDGAGRLYLYRAWDHERCVAEQLQTRSGWVTGGATPLPELLDRLFPAATAETDWQRVAAVSALTRHLTVISGGPGTGKTSTVARILALLLDGPEGERLRIRLAAPTGKAASRLRESILDAFGCLELSEAVQARMPSDVQTIHRLLGVIPDSPRFRHDASNPLACDLLVVDEVSMVDLPLMSRLLSALPADCRLILLGDQDQLASVEAGAVLADICNRGAGLAYSARFAAMVERCCVPLPDQFRAEKDATISPLADGLVNLTTSFRFGGESGIGRLARLINCGAAEQAFDLLASGDWPDLVWRELPADSDFEAKFCSAAVCGYAEYMAAADAAGALARLDRFRILSPYRQGACGVENLNRLAMSALGLERDQANGGSCRLPLMVTGNNYDLGLFNGDTAVLMPRGDRSAMAAWFADPAGGLRSLSVLRLPPHEPALALTVHKSQGSEFDRVLLILPAYDASILTRELLYTAITRARSSVEIWCSREVFCRAAERRIERSSGLRDRLWA